MSLTVLSFPKGAEIPEQLRHLADEIEAGEHGEIGTLAIATTGDDFCIFGLGGCDSIRMVGLFTTAATLVSTSLLEGEE